MEKGEYIVNNVESAVGEDAKTVMARLEAKEEIGDRGEEDSGEQDRRRIDEKTKLVFLIFVCRRIEKRGERLK